MAKMSSQNVHLLKWAKINHEHLPGRATRRKQFNFFDGSVTMKFPDRIKIGEKYGPAMEITGQQEANEYFEACVQHNLRRRELANQPIDRQEAEKVERINLGYYAGYYGDETQKRVERLFGSPHPIFGSVVEDNEGMPPCRGK